MKTFLKAVVLVPLVALAVGWAQANRAPATISLDLFNLGVTPYALDPAPLYLIVFAALAAGVAIGGVAVWFGQGRHRRQASRQRREAERLRGEVDQLRAAAPASSSALATR